MDNLSVTPEQNLEQPVVSPPPKINPLFIICGLIIIAIILTGGIFIGKNLNTSQNIPVKKITLIPTLYPSPTVTTIPDPTTNWKTYTNDAGYFFKYPSTFKTQLIAADTKLNEEANATSGQFIVYKTGSSNPYDERYVDFQITQLEPSYDDRMVTQTALNNYPVKKISFPNIKFEAYSIKTPKGEFVEIYVSKDPVKEVLANQILSTFKFLDVSGKSCKSDTDCGSGYRCMVVAGNVPVDENGKEITPPKTCYPNDAALPQ